MLRIAVVFIFLSLVAYAQPFWVIANSRFPKEHINKKELRNIYLDKKHQIDGKKILPLNYGYNNILRKHFEHSILKKTTQQLETYWIKAHYQGHRPPKVLKSTQSMLSYLRVIPNAIGYIDANTSLPSDINILLKVTR